MRECTDTRILESINKIHAVGSLLLMSADDKASYIADTTLYGASEILFDVVRGLEPLLDLKLEPKWFGDEDDAIGTTEKKLKRKGGERHD